MAETTYNIIVKLPIGKKDAVLVIDDRGDGTFGGTMSILGTTSPIEGTIDAGGNYHSEGTITTMLGTTDLVSDWKIVDGKIDGVAKNRMGKMPMKSPELW